MIFILYPETQSRWGGIILVDLKNIKTPVFGWHNSEDGHYSASECNDDRELIQFIREHICLY